MRYYIAGCVFTFKYPQLSQRIQEYVARLGDVEIVRCCTPKYKPEEIANKMPESYRAQWCELPDTGRFQAGDVVYSICHNCTAILKETRPDITVKSIWELILEDADFPYPNHGGRSVVVQDCWRSHDDRREQDAVRNLLTKMNIRYREQEESFDKTDFCGVSLYAPCIPRNAKLAPKRFVENAVGKFIPRSSAEQAELMKSYCHRFGAEEVVSYCHYCQDGLMLGGARATHLAQLLFG